jgi:dipeptidyl aminopeptidase/acylaminoacyl peptidase
MNRFVLGVVAILVAAQSGVAQNTLPPIESFAAQPGMSSVSLSPDGTRVAFLSGASNASRAIHIRSVLGNAPVEIIPLSTLDLGVRYRAASPNILVGGAGPSLRENVGSRHATGVSWLSDTHLFLTIRAQARFISSGESWNFQRSFMLNIASRDVIRLAPDKRLKSVLPDDTDHILVELLSGSGELIQTNRSGFGILDYQPLDDDRTDVRSGNPPCDAHNASSVLGTEGLPVALIFAGGVWSSVDREDCLLIRTIDYDLAREFHFDGLHWQEWYSEIDALLGGDRDRQVGYTRTRTTGEFEVYPEGRRSTIHTIDLVTGDLEGPIIASEVADIDTALTDWRDDTTIGFSWEDETHQVRYLDPEFASLQIEAETHFPGARVDLLGWDHTLNEILLGVAEGPNPPQFHVLHRATGVLTPLGESRPQLAQAANVEVIHYSARDGLDLFGYLTLPPGDQRQSLPLVLFPHGGPAARDVYEWNLMAQFMASRGYAVFQPQFRGSAGFGIDFQELGEGEWAGLMQTDLYDGMDHLASLGIIDPARACILGRSYGGYAALVGATLAPERFRCAVSFGGVSDLREMMRYERNRGWGRSRIHWARTIGDWRSDRAHIRDISPAHRVSETTAPILLLHGGSDLVVPADQSRRMADALADSGRPFEYQEFEGAGHYLPHMSLENRRLLLTTLEEFLVESNPPD